MSVEMQCWIVVKNIYRMQIQLIIKKLSDIKFYNTQVVLTLVIEKKYT